MSEFNINNCYNEYIYDFYVGFSKNMGEYLFFSVFIIGEYYKMVCYYVWVVYFIIELIYVMILVYIL